MEQACSVLGEFPLVVSTLSMDVQKSHLTIWTAFLNIGNVRVTIYIHHYKQPPYEL